MFSFIVLVFAVFLALASDSASEPSTSPDIVDLGYAQHIPTLVNETTSGRKVRIYKNIRFANSPTGELRFRLPDTDLPIIDAAPFPPYNGTTWGQEDCLFLDVYIPDNVRPSDAAPVLHWIVGSAYAFGSKDMFFIYVANNYRLGLPGWTYLPGEDMIANLGMHDSLAAVEWTFRFISRFGGDPNRVTVMGQSAAGGIINLLTVLNGGEGTLPFQQILTSAPCIPPRVNPIDRQKNLLDRTLNSANCTSLSCLRLVPEDKIKDVNDYLINQIPSDTGGGVFGPAPGFGPVFDGSFITDLPETLYQQGRFNRGLRSLIIGNAANEGMGVSSDEDMPEAFGALVRRALPTATNETVAEIQSYFDFGDTREKLAWDWTVDNVFSCNAANIDSAYKDVSRRYIFSVPPGTHGQDLTYAFFTDPETTPVENPDDAKAFQKNLLDFLYGREVDWPIYGPEKHIFNVTSGGFKDVKLPAELDARCKMVNRMIKEPANGA